MSDLETALQAVVAEATREARPSSAAEVRARADRRRAARGTGAVVVVVALALALVGLDGQRRDTAGSLGSPAQDPTALVGLWHVEVDGASAGSLSLGADLRVVGACGIVQGHWAADLSADFVASGTSASARCATPEGFLPSWLDESSSFRVDGPVRDLVDARGRVTARLTPQTTPDSGDPSRGVPPVLDAQLRDRLAEPAPLPEGVTGVTTSSLTGTWVPRPDAGVSQAFASFQADHVLGVSDGCTADRSRFTVGAAGRLLVLAMLTPRTGCDSSPIITWVISAGRAGLVNGDLVLYDHTGHELGRLSREQPTQRVSGVLELVGGPCCFGPHPSPDSSTSTASR